MSLKILVVALICAPLVLCLPTSFETSLNCIDPTVACQDLRTARQCGVVSSCIHDVWSTMSAPEDNEDICAVCKEMVKEARDQLLSNMTQEELKEVFEGSCKLLPVTLVQDACIKLVDEFIPQLVEMLASRMDPNMVCTVAGLCNVLHIPEQITKVNDNLECQFCTHVLEHVKQLITANTTVEEFRSALHNFCNQTGSFADKCSRLVDDYFDTIFSFIKTLDTKGFCTLIGLCGNEVSQQYSPLVKIIPPTNMRKKLPMMKLIKASPISKKFGSYPLVKIQPAMNPRKKQNDIESNEIFAPSNQLPFERMMHPSVVFGLDIDCPLCKAISFYLKEDLKADKTEIAVTTALKNVCSKWVKEFPDQCKAFVSKYSIPLKHRIVEGASFEDICFFAKACPLEENSKDLNVRVISNSNSNPICDLCKDAFNELENTLKDPSTKKSVENLLSQACNYLPSELRDECNDFIDQNLNTVFNILEEELTADNMCPLLRLCPQSGLVENAVGRKFNDLECDLCKDFVGQLQQRLKDPDVKQSLTTLLEKGCAMLPEQIAAECKSFVDQNIDNIINMVISDIDPNLVCTALNLCQSSIADVKKTANNDVECDFCKEIIQKVDAELKDQRTEESIKEALTKACSYLPSAMSGKCERFIRQYSTLLISLLAEELDPQLICATLKLCPASLKKPKAEVRGLECDLCKEIVGKLDDELKDKRTQDEIEAALKRVCSLLPSSISARCNKFIDTYSELLMSLMAAELDPTMVCAALNICPGDFEDMQELKDKAKDLECEGCRYLLHYVQNLLTDADSEVKIKDFMKKVCKLFPKTYDDNCEAYIDEFGSSLLAILATELDPSVVCTEMSLCGFNLTNSLETYTESESVKLDKCTMCTSVIDYLDKLLEEDDIDKEITTLIERVCTVIPATMKNECSALLDTYGPYILQMIGQLADSKTVCQAIEMCARTRGHAHLLGGEKCTFGPSYWCQSKVHAAACKAEVYCTENIWKK